MVSAVLHPAVPVGGRGYPFHILCAIRWLRGRMGRMGQRFSKTSCVHIRIRTHRLLIFIRPTAPSAPKLIKTQDFFIMNKPKYNPEMQLSENFRLKEFIESPLGAEWQGREKAEVTEGS